jgi:SOS response regulatory protein OraA/RecX
LTAEERMRQYRFLAQRGFTHRAIQAVLQAAAQANK